MSTPPGVAALVSAPPGVAALSPCPPDASPSPIPPGALSLIYPTQREVAALEAALFTRGDLLDSAVRICTAAPTRLAVPLTWQEAGGREVWTPIATYSRRIGGRLVQGCTVGAIHPLPGCRPRPFAELPQALGTVDGVWAYLYVEGITDAAARRRAEARIARLLRRGWTRWTVRMADIDPASASRLFGFDVTPAVVADSARGGQAAVFDGLLRSPEDPQAVLDRLLGPERHAPLRRAIKRLLARRPGPQRIVAYWGAMHLPGIERDVWHPLGFKRVSLTWRVGAAVEVDDTTGAVDAGCVQRPAGAP